MISLFYFQEFVDVLSTLPDEDMPSFFGLPANIERSSQRIISTQVTISISNEFAFRRPCCNSKIYLCNDFIFIYPFYFPTF